MVVLYEPPIREAVVVYTCVTDPASDPTRAVRPGEYWITILDAVPVLSVALPDETTGIVWQQLWPPAPLTLPSVDALPVADETRRGQLILVRGTDGVADAAYLCAKDASDQYVWQPL